MNIQKDEAGIEWTRVHGLPGATWNPTAGCYHNCMWQMPDGDIIQCYAKTIAERLAASAYPEGFAHHYWHPHRLDEPLKQKTPHGIFVGSMADLFGHWVPEAQLRQVIRVMKRAHWHTFLVLTKNPRRLMSHRDLSRFKIGPGVWGGLRGALAQSIKYRFPPNVWVGASLPGGPLTQVDNAKSALMMYLRYLDGVRASVRFMSFEPLWFDAASVLWRWRQALPVPIDWAIIGASSNGSKLYQPDPAWVEGLLGFCDAHDIPVFMKGNLDWHPFRQDFPSKGHSHG